MQKTSSYIGFAFVFIFLLVIWGFYKSYFSLFPHFKGMVTVQHFHGLMMLSWFAVLIAQPFLIRYKLYQWHRWVGRFTYLLVPFIVLSLFLITRFSFNHMAGILPEAVNAGGLSLNLPDLIIFPGMYLLAIIHKKNTPFHLRYIIGTSLLLIGPGIGRAMILYGGIPFPLAIEYVAIITDVLAGALLLADILKRRPWQPFAVVFIAILLKHFLWEFQMAGWWQAFASKFAQLFF